MLRITIKKRMGKTNVDGGSLDSLRHFDGWRWYVDDVDGWWGCKDDDDDNSLKFFLFFSCESSLPPFLMNAF